MEKQEKAKHQFECNLVKTQKIFFYFSLVIFFFFFQSEDNQSLYFVRGMLSSNAWGV